VVAIPLCSFQGGGGEIGLIICFHLFSATLLCVLQRKRQSTDLLHELLTLAGKKDEKTIQLTLGIPLCANKSEAISGDELSV